MAIITVMGMDITDIKVIATAIIDMDRVEKSVPERK